MMEVINNPKVVMSREEWDIVTGFCQLIKTDLPPMSEADLVQLIEAIADCESKVNLWDEDITITFETEEGQRGEN